MTYRVDLTPQAQRQLKKIPGRDQQWIITTIESLAVEPRPHGCESIAGHRGYLRMRVGDFRVVYTVGDAVLRVIVVLVGHRRDVYRLLSDL